MLAMPEIELVQESIRLAHLTSLAEASFGELVKAVVDADLGIMCVAGELHADEEALLLDAGSQHNSLWGINLYPAEYGRPGWIEFDSMINVRPRVGNRSRSVEDAAVRDRIVEIIDRLVVA